MQLDDSILKKIETSDKPELKEAKDLISRIRRRDLYQVSYYVHHIYEKISWYWVFMYLSIFAFPSILL